MSGASERRESAETRDDNDAVWMGIFRERGLYRRCVAAARQRRASDERAVSCHHDASNRGSVKRRL